MASGADRGKADDPPKDLLDDSEQRSVELEERRSLGTDLECSNTDCTGDDEQLIDALDGAYDEHFMLHYNFPPFSTGEVKKVGSPGRREIGHGKLAWRAVHPMLPAKEQFPYTSAFGFEYDSGDYHMALKKVLDAVDYPALRAEQAAKRADPNSPTLMGIGLVTFTEVVGAGPSKMCDILGVGMFDSCEIRIHPTGSAIARMGTITQGQGHQTTYAQIIATELGARAGFTPEQQTSVFYVSLLAWVGCIAGALDDIGRRYHEHRAAMMKRTVGTKKPEGLS